MSLRNLPIYLAIVAATALLAGAPSPAAAEGVKVRLPEGPTHGFIVLTDLNDKPLAHGELVQFLEKDEVVNRLVIRFNDGSLYDERLRFSQQGRFRLLSYQLVQKGPSFKENSRIEFDRSGRYRASVRAAPDEKEEEASGTFDIPDDVSNGMTSTLLKNLAPGATAKTHLLAFTPEPQLLELNLTPEGSDEYWVGSAGGAATRYVMKPEVTGLRGVVASVVGKQPPEFRMWIAKSNAPTLVRFEGPMYADGPPWRIAPAGPSWKKPSGTN